MGRAKTGNGTHANAHELTYPLPNMERAAKLVNQTDSIIAAAAALHASARVRARYKEKRAQHNGRNERRRQLTLRRRRAIVHSDQTSPLKLRFPNLPSVYLEQSHKLKGGNGQTSFYVNSAQQTAKSCGRHTTQGGCEAHPTQPFTMQGLIGALNFQE